MKIAIVAPSPVPFQTGGAEYFWNNFRDALSDQPGVEAELIKIPSPERSFWEIVDSYQSFCELDLRHFDRIVTGKYPAWMVSHPDHTVYMLHKLRGLYDTWPQGLNTAPPRGRPELENLIAVLVETLDSRLALEDIFGRLSELRACADELDPYIFGLPGPLIRLVVRALDRIGLSLRSIRRFVSISDTVASRRDYFPAGARVETLHPPAPVRDSSTGSAHQDADASIFAVSRLDSPKRLDWVIKAHQKSGTATPLIIAGDGPERARLEALAKDDPLISFVGRIEETRLTEYYAHSLFTVFVPDREDYGLVALEALQNGCPVVTCSDSGGVTELVRHRENGLIAEPSVDSLSEQIRLLATDKALRNDLAKGTRESVKHICWPAFASQFCKPRPRLLVVNTFGIYPPMNGGQQRMFQLYRQLAYFADIKLVNLTHAAASQDERQLLPGLTEVLVPMTEAHSEFEQQLEGELKTYCSDIAAMLEPGMTPDWLNIIDREAEAANLVMACHPYGYPAIRAVFGGPIIYESLNVEGALKAAIFGHAESRVSEVAQVEAECAKQAPLVLCCSEEDSRAMKLAYGLDQLPVTIANGVDAASYPDLDAAGRSSLRHRIGVESQFIALFVGSLHGPNIDALRSTMDIAKACPDVLFWIIGSVCEADDLPEPENNTCFFGRLSNSELRVCLAAADVGLNPVTTGSGTNLKLLEYAAAGLPVLSTPFGARGGILRPEQDIEVTDLDDFSDRLNELASGAESEGLNSRTQAARDRAVRLGDWRVIADQMWQAISSHASRGQH